MPSPDLERERLAVIREHGEWIHHDVALGGGLFTMGGDPRPRMSRRLERLVQTVADVVDRPFEDVRLLDLACNEGLQALEFAAHGAEVVGIEARGANVAKAEFGRRALQLERVEFIHDDVRNLRVETHGRFDAVLCLGILYHLDAPDVFDLLARIGEVCTKVALIDTNLSIAPDEQRTWRGESYAGHRHFEHDPDSTGEERERALKRSIDNPEAFWLTRASLLNALTDVGFTSVQECLTPGGPERRDRPTLMALKGEPRTLRVVANARPPGSSRWPERENPVRHPDQRRLYRAAVRHRSVRRVGARMPTGVRRRIRRFFQR